MFGGLDEVGLLHGSRAVCVRRQRGDRQTIAVLTLASSPGSRPSATHGRTVKAPAKPGRPSPMQCIEGQASLYGTIPVME